MVSFVVELEDSELFGVFFNLFVVFMNEGAVLFLYYVFLTDGFV